MDYFTLISDFLSFLMYLVVLFIVFEVKLLLDERLRLSFTYLGIAALGMTATRILEILIEAGIIGVQRFKDVVVIIAPIFFMAGLLTFYKELKSTGSGHKREAREAPLEKPLRKSVKKPKLRYSILGKYLDLTGKNPRFRS